MHTLGWLFSLLFEHCGSFSICYYELVLLRQVIQTLYFNRLQQISIDMMQEKVLSALSETGLFAGGGLIKDKVC
jgi:hypothetical protein